MGIPYRAGNAAPRARKSFCCPAKTGWKIKGVNGAAELLGVKPTTLISRIEKMGLKRPASKPQSASGLHRQHELEGRAKIGIGCRPKSSSVRFHD